MNLVIDNSAVNYSDILASRRAIFRARIKLLGRVEVRARDRAPHNEKPVVPVYTFTLVSIFYTSLTKFGTKVYFKLAGSKIPNAHNFR